MIRRLWLFSLLTACSGQGDTEPATAAGTSSETEASASDTDATDTEVDRTSMEPLEISAELTDVVTVIRVSWTTAEPTTARVEFGEDTDYGLATPVETEASTEHEVLLLGNAADTPIHFQVVSVDGEAEVASVDQEFSTGTLPAELPTLTAEGEAQHWAHYQVVPTQGTARAVVMFDTRGEVVWYHVIEESFNVMRAALSADKEHVVIGLAGMTDEDKDEGYLRYVSLDGSDIDDVLVPYFDHDFTMLPDGTIAAIVLTRSFCCPNVADSIVEVATDGTLTTIWDAWDHLDYDLYGEGGGGNWTHANALDYSAKDDAYYVSLKSLGTIVKVDRSTGESLWMLNGAANEFTFADGEQPVTFQHQLDRTDDGLLIFANELPDVDDSQAVELSLDEEALTAEYVWRYSHDPPLSVFAKGDVFLLEDDAVEVVWSSSGEIEEVTAEGEVVWRLNTDLGYAFTFSTFTGPLYAEAE